jgi:hypothetical protein
MNAQAVMQGLVEIIKQGGPLALWGVGLWLLIGLMRIFLVGLVVYLVVKIVCRTILDYKVASFKQVTLVSEQMGKDIASCLDNFVNNAEVLFTKLESQLNELKTNSDKT